MAGPKEYKLRRMALERFLKERKVKVIPYNEEHAAKQQKIWETTPTAWSSLGQTQQPEDRFQRAREQAKVRRAQERYNLEEERRRRESELEKKRNEGKPERQWTDPGVKSTYQPKWEKGEWDVRDYPAIGDTKQKLEEIAKRIQEVKRKNSLLSNPLQKYDPFLKSEK